MFLLLETLHSGFIRSMVVDFSLEFGSIRSLVWAANRDQPVQNGSTIQLRLEGNLGFTDSQGRQSWIYNGSTSVNSAAMLDTGQTLGHERPLCSNRMDGDYGTSRFMLVLQSDGNLILHPKGRRNLTPDLEYYSSGTDGAKPPLTVVFDHSGVLHQPISIKKKGRFHKVSSGIEKVETDPIPNLISFRYARLQEATHDFKEVLGRGSFGSVYKGILDLGHRVEIAVKQLDKVVERGEKEFRTEVSVIGQTHHKNLVRLLGFCDEGDHRLLVCEFIQNGSLANFFFGPTRPNWSQRVQLALGIARGILYLHEECESPIIHCDIKPQNILLDKFYNPKVADFGLAKLLQQNETRTITTSRGTNGYVAPEWFRNVSV
ncbi:hypothetical protein AMTRI_Chr03g138830 [Amborella trichopoda]